ncbi:hypothetical protein [Mycobacteroides abscessus]|uniref:hypothetical protein n=1 Tax=Mycobacteroides abscessus TaxID=36809 RepID=UPI0010442B5A|nr:hypothetical protein [Mycobacteroides abscessus]
MLDNSFEATMYGSAYGAIRKRAKDEEDAKGLAHFDLDTAADLLRQRAAVDDADRADVRKSYRARLLMGLLVHIVILMLLSLPVVMKLSALLVHAAGADAVPWTWGIFHNAITAGQALAINGGAFGAAVAISAALAIVAALTGRRAVEDALWRRNVQRVVDGAALTTTVVTLLLCIGGVGRSAGSLFGVSAFSAGTCVLAVTTLTHTSQTARAENYRYLEHRLGQLLEWRAELHGVHGVPRAYAGPGRAPYKHPVRTSVVALCFGSVGAFAGLVPLLCFYLDHRAMPLSVPLLTFFLALISGSFVAMAVLLIGTQRWTRFPPKPDARDVNRVFYVLMSLTFGLGGLAFCLSSVDRWLGSMLITWWVTGQLAVMALYWGRRVQHPRWVAFLAWPTYARVNAELDQLDEHFERTAARQLLDEAASIPRLGAGRRRRRSWALIRAAWRGPVTVKGPRDQGR